MCQFKVSLFRSRKTARELGTDMDKLEDIFVESLLPYWQFLVNICGVEINRHSPEADK